MERKPDFARLVRDRIGSIQADGDVPLDTTLFGSLVTRQLRRREERKGLSISGLGACARQIGYKLLGEEENGRHLDARALVTFAVGDFIEALLTTVLVHALPTIGWSIKDYGEGQGEVTLTLKDEMGTRTVVGHRDGVLVSPDSDRCTLEVKSMSSYAFTLFERNKGFPPTESYYWQHQAYLHADNNDHGYVLAVCKDSGVVDGFWTTREERVPQWLAMHLDAAEAGERRLPDMTQIKPNDKGKLPWQCCYCSYWKTCHPEARAKVDRDFRGRPSTALYVPLTVLKEAV